MITAAPARTRSTGAKAHGDFLPSLKNKNTLCDFSKTEAMSEQDTELQFAIEQTCSLPLIQHTHHLVWASDTLNIPSLEVGISIALLLTTSTVIVLG